MYQIKKYIVRVRYIHVTDIPPQLGFGNVIEMVTAGFETHDTSVTLVDLYPLREWVEIFGGTECFENRCNQNNTTRIDFARFVRWYHRHRIDTLAIGG